MAFDLSSFVSQYYIQPIMSHEGYNPVNTVTYAAIALVAAYFVWGYFKSRNIKIDREFFISVLPFVLFGSTMRVLTDSIDTGVMQQHTSGALGGIYSFVLSTHVYDYGFLTSSPGIYVVTSALLFLFLYLQTRFSQSAWSKNLVRNAGCVLWVFHLLLLLPMVAYPLYPAIILALAGIVWLGARYASQKLKLDPLASLVVFAHALDGAATFVTIDLFNRLEPACTVLGKCYFEQHVLSRFIGAFADTFFVFFAAKVVFASVVAYVIDREAQNEQEKIFVFLLVVIFGLAPGLRDLLRVATGA